MSREKVKESIDRILTDATDEELADIRVFALVFKVGDAETRKVILIV